MAQNRKLGMVVFGSDSGLGNQSRRLTYLLRPERILLIDSSPFSPNKDQHPEWYSGFTGYTVKGFPTDKAVDMFLKDLTHVFILENPLNWRLIKRAHQLGIKTFIHCNYEFCDNLNHPIYPLPDTFLMPSHWMIGSMKSLFGANKVKYLPPPIDPNEFKEARETNLKRRGQFKFLHIVGTSAAMDRNGTLSILEALKHTTQEFSLTIKSQHDLKPEYMTDDRRVRYTYGSEPIETLYKDFDAMILPRRYGGLCLPMGEAMMSGLPVIMTDISPNNEMLPMDWLVKATKTDELMTRTVIDINSADPISLATVMDQLIRCDIESQKLAAFEMAHNTFAPSNLAKEYDELWQK